MPNPPSARIIIPIVGALVGVVVWFLTRSSYVTSTWPRVFAIGSFIVIYVMANILMGVVQGMREAQAKKPAPGVPAQPRPAAPPSAAPPPSSSPPAPRA